MEDGADADHETKPSGGLSEEESEAVAERKAGTARVVHEVIRLQGDDELGRPVLSLLFSGFAAGIAISVSVMAEALLEMALPQTPWARLVSSFGYCVGFVIVIMGNLQLFTENTVTAVLPIATHPTRRNLRRLMKLWASVLVANLAGTFLVATLIATGIILSPDARTAAIGVAARIGNHDALHTFLLGMPAGFLVAAIAWILPNARGSEFWVIVMITYVIAIGGFSHVVAGSTEAWLLWLVGRMTGVQAVVGFILPALLGNIVGGTGLFAVLAHGQVRGEIKPNQS